MKRMIAGLLLVWIGLADLAAQPFALDYLKDNQNAIIRSDRAERRVRLLFTGHEFADGAAHILKTLKRQKVKGYFFLTGDFVRRFPTITRQLYRKGHYVGPHSDKHLLYCDWDKRDSLLVEKEAFLADLEANYQALEAIGVPRQEPALYVAPYEWYNTTISLWCTEKGIKLINFTPSTGTNADYTYPGMDNYRSSDLLLRQLLDKEKQNPGWLAGAHLLIHIGTDPRRTDKLYYQLGNLVSTLRERGYVL
ncbi:MAG: polysaccharide deacetylase family protein [Saprospiraceae bacterium]